MMQSKPWWRHATLVASASLIAGGCHTFVLREEPVTPEPAPVTRVDVAGRDTTYVLRTSGYALLSRDRRLLWTRAAIDDAAHRYRALLGAEPPAIAVRVDTAPAATGGTWEGLPLVAVRAAPPAAQWVMAGEAGARDLPQVAARVADAWVRALGIPASAWWLEVGAVRLVSDGDARVAVLKQAADAGERTSLAAVLGAPRPADAGIVTGAITRARPRDDDGARARPVGTSVYAPDGAAARPEPLPTYRGPLVSAQAAALLLFLRDRDSSFVAALPARLRGGATLPDLLARSDALPHATAAFDAAWRTWLRARAAGRRPSPPKAER